MKIPKQYLPVMPYLVFKDSEAFLDFVQKVFNIQPQLKVPGEDCGIVHGKIKIKDYGFSAGFTDSFRNHQFITQSE